jgi:hypothetical protein
MVTNFDATTQHLVFKPEYAELPIEVIKSGIHYMTIYPDQATQDQMIEYFTTCKLWHLFDIIDNPV